MNQRLFLGLIFLCLALLVLGVLIWHAFLLTPPAAGIQPAASQNLPPVAAAQQGHNLAPIASNQWYSNVYAQFPTQPLYAEPAAFELSPAGLGVSLPDVHKAANSIFAPYITDLQVGFADPLQKPAIQQIGDWSIQLAMQTAQHESMQFTLAHGAPFTVIHVNGTTSQLTCGASCQLFIDNSALLAPGSSASGQVFSLVVRGHTYLLSIDGRLQVSFSGRTLLLHGAKRIYLAALPARTAYALFRENAATEILGTTAAPASRGNTLETTYIFASSGPAPLVALYPHQWKYLARPLTRLGSYATIRGTLILVQARAFTTALPLDIPSPNFSALRPAPADLEQQLQSDIQSFIAHGPPGSKDYYLGVWFGRGSDLLKLAQALGKTQEEEKLLAYMEPLFARCMAYFHYDASKTSVIANAPEFGNENLNDHHFHYGYFIRSAAVLAAADPSFLARVRAPIDEMVADIGNAQRSDSQFPYLRNFDVYEGHSWADGFAKFADGNDQESTSEAIQAWYSLYLWSLVTHNLQLRAVALYLYTTEIASVKEYWFGENGLYTAPYQHAIASIVWGGKVDFATWFSHRPGAIYGISDLTNHPGIDLPGKARGIRSLPRRPGALRRDDDGVLG